MNFILAFLLIGLFLINCIQLHAMHDYLEKANDTLLDLDIIYLKLQQALRND